MTIKDLLSVLIRDNMCISIQTKDKDGLLAEVANDNRIFNSSLENYYDCEIKLIKPEKKKLFIII